METINNVMQYVLRHKKRLTTYVAVGIAVLVLYAIYTSFFILSIEVIGSGDNNSFKLYRSSLSENSLVGPLSNIAILPRDTKSIIVSDDRDSMQTQSRVDVPWYGYVSKKIKLEKDKDAEKIAYRSTIGAECATYSPELKKLLYYTCSNPTSLMKYETPANRSWYMDKISDLDFTNKTATPYLGGIIGSTYGWSANLPWPDITYHKPNGKKVGFGAPENVQRPDLLKEPRFFTDNDPRNSKFIYTTFDGGIYLATPDKDFKKVSYKKIPVPEKFSHIYNRILCTLNQSDVYCLVVRKAKGDIPQNFDWETTAKTTVIKTSFSNEGVSTYPVDNAPVGIDNFYASSSGELFYIHGKNLSYLRLFSDKYRPESIAQNVDTASGGARVVYVQQNRVFNIDLSTLDAYQMFYSPNVDIRNIYQANSAIYVIGYAGGDKDNTRAYKILDRDNPGNRMIDSLPFNAADLYSVRFNDLIGNRLYVEIFTPTERTATGRRIDTYGVNFIKQEVADYLQRRGIRVNNIQYSL